MAEEASVALSESQSSIQNDTVILRDDRPMEYETQHLGFTPQSFCDGVYNAIVGYTFDCLTATQKYLQEEFQGIVPPDHIEKGTEKLLTRTQKSIDKTFEKLEVYLQSNLFSIPPHVVLPEDQVHLQYPHTESELAALNEEIAELKRKVANSKFVTARFRQELLDMQKVQKEYEKAMEPFLGLDDFCHEQGATDCKEAMLSVTEKVVKLKDLVDSIKPLDSKKRSTPEEPEDRMKKFKVTSTEDSV